MTESAVDSSSHVLNLTVIRDGTDYTAVTFELTSGETKFFAMANNNADPNTVHTLSIDSVEYQWAGPYLYAER